MLNFLSRGFTDNDEHEIVVTLSTEFIFLKYPKSFPDTLRHLDNFISFCSIYKLLKDQSHVVWFDAEGIPPPPTSFVRPQQGIFYRALKNA